MSVIRRARSRAFLAVLLALASTGLWSATTSPAHAAVVCQGWKAYADFDPTVSDTFTKPSDTSCKDLNAAYVYSRKDKVRGWYKNSTGWHVGTNQYVVVTTCDCGWKVLLSSVVAGTTMRGEGFAFAQYVRFVA